MDELNKITVRQALCRNIRHYRNERKLSQGEVATNMGVSIAAFSKMETGVTDITLSRIAQIAFVLEVNVGDLLAIGTASEIENTYLTELLAIQKRLHTREDEIIFLQRKLIDLYEESKR